MILHRSVPAWALTLAVALGAFSSPVRAQAPVHAHVHGVVELDVVVDGPSVVIGMEAPLDNFLGFERAPRTDVEKQAAADVIARLRAAEMIFKIDPVANCKLGPVTLKSAVLGLGKPEPGEPEGHADLDGSFAFNCTNAAAAKFIDVGLFDAFKNVRQIEAQVAASQGQFKRTLKRPNGRLAWSR